MAGLSTSAQTARIYFIDIGQGASTLIVSPTGKSLLVDGGPGGGGTGKIIPLLNTLGISTLDFTVLTHYHIDHNAGLTEVLSGGRVAGIAYDNGDGADVAPPGPGSTYTAYQNYLNAIAAQSGAVTRQTLQPGTVLDLGGGMRATCLLARGLYLSGATLPVSNQDLNTQSISLLIEFGNFNFLVSGDLTGGGGTSAAITPDLESYVAQLAGDVNALQLDHHGSLTSNNRRFLAALKAEIAVAAIGESNGFGHPSIEIVNRYLNTPVTNGNVYSGTGIPAPGMGPVFYQSEASPPGDGRTSAQGYSGAAAGAVGSGTILLQTDGAVNFSMRSFDDGGVRLSPALHTYALDGAGAGAGVTTNFPPTVIAAFSPAVPLSTEAVTISAQIHDREDPITSATLNYSLNGVAQTPVAMSLSGGIYTAIIPAQPNATRVEFAVSGIAGGVSTTDRGGYFSGLTPISALRSRAGLGEAAWLGFAARISGTVTAGTGTYSLAGNHDDYVEDATGAINVYRTQQPLFPSTTPECPGQAVQVRGRIGIAEGQIRLEVTPPFGAGSSPYGVTVLSSGSPPAAASVTLAQLAAAPEARAGRLVQIINGTITAGTIPAAPATFDSYLTLNDGTASFTLKIDADTDIPGLATPAASFTLTGIVQQDDALRPFTSGYSIAPRRRADLNAPPLLPSFVYALPAAGSVMVRWENTLQGGDYRIERAAGSCAGSWSAVATRARVSGTTNSYTDTAAPSGITACYRIVSLTDACGGGTPTVCNGNSCAIPPASIPGPCVPAVVLSQVYGGGGNSGAPYTNDFLELHNRGPSPVSLAGWSVQYASAAGTNWAATALSGSIPAGGYYLVQEASGGASGIALPAPNAAGTISLSASAGKVALVSSTTPLSGSCPQGGALVNLVGYGATASCFETSPAPAGSNTEALLRATAGCADSDSNAADFAAAAPAPRGSAPAPLTCACQLFAPVEVSGTAAGKPMRLLKNGDGSLALDFEAIPGATGYNLYTGDPAMIYNHATGANLCAAPTTVPTPGYLRAQYPAAPGAAYFLITAFNSAGEGSAGFAFDGTEIPAAQSSCTP